MRNERKGTQPVIRCMLYRGDDRVVFTSEEDITSARADGWEDAPPVSKMEPPPPVPDLHDEAGKLEAVERHASLLAKQNEELTQRIVELENSEPTGGPNQPSIVEMEKTIQSMLTERLLVTEQMDEKDLLIKSLGTELKSTKTKLANLRKKRRDAG